VLNISSNWRPLKVTSKFTYAWYYGHCTPKCTAWQQHLQWVHNELENLFHIPHSVHYNSVITILTKNAYSLKLQQSYKIPTPTGFGPHWPIIREHTIVRNCCLMLSKFCITMCKCFIKTCAVALQNYVQLFYTILCNYYVEVCVAVFTIQCSCFIQLRPAVYIIECSCFRQLCAAGLDNCA